MFVNVHSHPRPRPDLAARIGDDSFELYFKIPPVILLFGARHHFTASEHTHAGRLLRELDQLGRDGVRIRGIITHEGAADLSSLRALNCYLRHCDGLAAYNRARNLPPRWRSFTKYDWSDLRRLVGLRFVA